MAETDEKGKSFERMCALTLAFLAAVLAITDLVASRFDSDANTARVQKAYMHDWYNAKGIKQNLAESHADMLSALVITGSVSKEVLPALRNEIETARGNVARYKREKAEMTLGSEKVGRANWVQIDDYGKLGKIVGTKQWNLRLTALENAGELFHLSKLMLHLGFVLGTVSLILDNLKMKHLFYGSLVALGATGLGMSGIAFRVAFSA